MPAIGANVAIIHDGQIVLTQREDVEVWCLPGGHLEANETLPQAAIREAREETGLAVKLIRLVGVYSQPRWRDGMHTVLFAARAVGGRLCHSDETLDVRYFDPDRLPELLFWWHRRQIRDALQGVGGSVVWSQDRVWPFEHDMTRAELYALRDRSGLSRAAFYTEYLGRPGDERQEV